MLLTIQSLVNMYSIHVLFLLGKEFGSRCCLVILISTCRIVSNVHAEHLKAASLILSSSGCSSLHLPCSIKVVQLLCMVWLNQFFKFYQNNTSMSTVVLMATTPSVQLKATNKQTAWHKNRKSCYNKFWCQRVPRPKRVKENLQAYFHTFMYVSIYFLANVVPSRQPASNI